MTYNTDHYEALMFRLSNEKARLEACTKPKEIELRKVWVMGIEKEIASEVEFLKSKGIEVYASIDDLLLSDDDLMNELFGDVVEAKEVAVEQPQAISKEQAVITTRQWFADNAQACIDEAVSGQVRVNNLASYVADQTQRIQDCLAGNWDHTLAFQQRMVYVQTGVCHAILP